MTDLTRIPGVDQASRLTTALTTLGPWGKRWLRLRKSNEGRCLPPLVFGGLVGPTGLIQRVELVHILA